jgi:hypothetical protein
MSIEDRGRLFHQGLDCIHFDGIYNILSLACRSRNSGTNGN